MIRYQATIDNFEVSVFGERCADGTRARSEGVIYQ